MPEAARDVLCVRTLAGSVWLSVPRADAEDLRAAGLRRRLSEIVAARVAPGISEGRLLLTIGAHALHDRDAFKAFWPEHGGDLDVQLTIRRTREDEVEQAVLTLLSNEVLATGGNESCATAVEELAAIELRSPSELQSLAQAIYAQAVAHPSHSEYCADVVSGIRGRCPHFPPDTEGDHPVSCLRTLLNIVQAEHERLTGLPNDDEEAAGEEWRLRTADAKLEMQKRKGQLLANTRFIGCLYLRRLVALKVIGQVVFDFVGIKSVPPEEHMIHCVCELLRTIGAALDGGAAHGRQLLSQFLGRLLDLRGALGPDGRTLYSERIQSQIDGLLDLRFNSWREDSAVRVDSDSE